MSLRAFHVFFIAVSILLAVWVGAWGVRVYLAEGNLGSLALAVVFVVAGLVLALYFVRVRRKLKELGPEE